MGRWMMSLALAALPTQGLAGTLVCQFTEPFFTISYDSQSGTVTQVSADEVDLDTGKPIPKVLARGATLRKVESQDYFPRLRLVTGEEVILELRPTGEGTDGMSENIYPFEADHGGRIGGCETAKYPAYDVYDMLEDIGAPP